MRYSYRTKSLMGEAQRLVRELEAINGGELKSLEHFKMVLRTVNENEFIDAIESPDFRYVRARSWKASGDVSSDSDYRLDVYHFDSGFGKGVSRKLRFNDFALGCELMDERKIPSPLSPTEGL